MLNADIKRGGCACGQLRFEIKGVSIGAAACHCSACQKRTGSAFGVGCFFKLDSMEIIAGEYACYERIADSNRSVTYRFCPQCGSSVMWLSEAMPSGIGIAGGSFDDRSWIQPSKHAWTKEAQGWFSFTDGIETLEKATSE